MNKVKKSGQISTTASFEKKNRRTKKNRLHHSGKTPGLLIITARVGILLGAGLFRNRFLIVKNIKRFD